MLTFIFRIPQYVLKTVLSALVVARRIAFPSAVSVAAGLKLHNVGRWSDWYVVQPKWYHDNEVSHVAHALWRRHFRSTSVINRIRKQTKFPFMCSIENTHTHTHRHTQESWRTHEWGSCLIWTSVLIGRSFSWSLSNSWQLLSSAPAGVCSSLASILPCFKRCPRQKGTHWRGCWEFADIPGILSFLGPHGCNGLILQQFLSL